MLTFIGRILGILGIILLILFIVFLLVLLLALFVPIAYRIQGVRDETRTEAHVRVSWLFGLFRMNYHYPEPGRPIVKFLWFTFADPAKKKKRKKSKTDTPNKKKKAFHEPEASEDGESSREKQLEDSSKKDSPSQANNFEEAEDKQNDSKDSKVLIEEKSKTVTDDEGFFFSRIVDRIYEKYNKIKYTFGKICDKIKDVLNHLDYYRELLTQEETNLIIGSVFGRIGSIMKILRPRKIKAQITFGTGEPDITAYLLGAYCMMSPILGNNINNINVTPDFENIVFIGNFQASGHILSAVLLYHTLRMFFDKKLRLFMRKMKREEV